MVFACEQLQPPPTSLAVNGKQIEYVCGRLPFGSLDEDIMK